MHLEKNGNCVLIKICLPVCNVIYFWSASSRSQYFVKLRVNVAKLGKDWKLILNLCGLIQDKHTVLKSIFIHAFLFEFSFGVLACFSLFTI